jgi:hypothetical protein
MSLSDLASVGSFVSAIAVVISLVYLSVQIRQNTRHQRASMQQARAASTVDMMLRTTEAEMPETILRGRAGDPDLEPEKLEKFLRIMTAIFVNFEDGYLLRRAGMLDSASDSEALRHHILPHAGYRAAWTILHRGLQPDFQKHVEAILQETPINASFDRRDLWKKTLTEQSKI